MIRCGMAVEIGQGRPFANRAEPTHALNSLPRRPHIRYEGRTGSRVHSPIWRGWRPGVPVTRVTACRCGAIPARSDGGLQQPGRMPPLCFGACSLGAPEGRLGVRAWALRGTRTQPEGARAARQRQKEIFPGPRKPSPSRTASSYSTPHCGTASSHPAPP